ncbi:metal ABC transporter permease [Leucobacter sp. UT-8R-CII-1-4]|uniref:metal ABC transporter permease n=1 Tax=Leucobacter sp. UT-8R-CII-1-4 TaxID=3040075 RepID=UPI0024A8C37A|nr:metal ABC transporter permease [Leucobacter sp. UT-8R-CII-1-4]MDI6023529.1 metal ABC transporter permease [Leucobacter sp. UT-8R-CII-1-4]
MPTERQQVSTQMDVSFFEAFQLPFMMRAFLTVAVLAVAAGVVGLGISFREMEFVSDGLVHAVFPGLVIGAMIGGTAGLLPGALGAALVAALVFTLLDRRGGAGSDAAIAVGLTGLFSLGIVLVSKQQGFVAQLQDLLFGHLLTVTEDQLWQILVVAILAIAVMLLTGRAQLFRAFDPVGFEAAGFKILRTDLALAAATALLVVAGVQALGVLMVVALLTVPMAVARLVTKKIAWLVPIAVLVPLVAGTFGLWLSFVWSVEYEVSVSPGALVVLLLVALYLVAVVFRLLVVRRGRVGSVHLDKLDEQETAGLA